MRNWTSLLVALGILLAGNTARADESNLPTLETEYYYRKIYLSKPKHKAMAIGLNGSFGTSWNYGSDKEAAKNAIAYCRKGFANRKNSSGKDSKCHLAAIGNKPMANNALSLPTWQVAATGVDQPLSSGVRHLIPEGKSRGIVLAVHGCNGMGSLIYNSTWGGFYNSLGLDFYAPNSFADKTPSCGMRE
jgi:hypothetical protein